MAPHSHQLQEVVRLYLREKHSLLFILVSTRFHYNCPEMDADIASFLSFSTNSHTPNPSFTALPCSVFLLLVSHFHAVYFQHRACGALQTNVNIYNKLRIIFLQIAVVELPYYHALINHN
jgi:hypothetical protein